MLLPTTSFAEAGSAATSAFAGTSLARCDRSRCDRSRCARSRSAAVIGSSGLTVRGGVSGVVTCDSGTHSSTPVDDSTHAINSRLLARRTARPNATPDALRWLTLLPRAEVPKENLVFEFANCMKRSDTRKLPSAVIMREGNQGGCLPPQRAPLPGAALAPPPGADREVTARSSMLLSEYSAKRSYTTRAKEEQRRT